MKTIKFTAKYSSTGNVILSQTVLKAIGAIAAAGQQMMSTQDVTAAINENVYTDEQVEEKKVAVLLKGFAKDYATGYRYNALRGTLKSIDGYWFEYK